MNFLRNLLIWWWTPERADGWSQKRWIEWLSASSRVFFLATEPSIRRRAFAPFSLEPVFFETDFADQLFREVQRNTPNALPKFAVAALRTLARWRPADGHELALFLLKLVFKLGGFIGNEQLFGCLRRMINDLGPPLAANQLQDILGEIVECAVSRLETTELRELGTSIEGRGKWGPVQVWQAQSLLLDALVQKDKNIDVLATIATVAPRLPEITLRNSSAKHFLADTIVDNLELKGVAELMQSKASSDVEWQILKILRHCIFPYRIIEESGLYRDQLYPEITYQLSTEVRKADPNDLFEETDYLVKRNHELLTSRLFPERDRNAA